MELLEKTIHECLSERVKRTPYKTAIETERQIYRWLQLDRLSDYMAIRLKRIGVGKDSFVGIWSTNSPNWIITYLALIKLGAVPVLINTGYCVKEIENVLEYTHTNLVCYGEGYKQVDFCEIVWELQQKKDIQNCRWIFIGRDENGEWLSEKSFLAEEKAVQELEYLENEKKRVHPEQTAAMLFTSGTTCSPKGVMLSHRSLVNNAFEMSRHMRWKVHDKMLVAVPLFHCFGLTAGLITSIHAGFAVHLVPYYRTQVVLETIQTFQCTLMNGVPSMFLAMIRNPKFHEYDINSLRKGIIAGSSISEEEYIKICSSIPQLVLYPSYGQTETSPCVSIGDVGDTKEEKARTVGRIIDHVQVRIIDIQTGDQLKDGKSGEILVKGYNVMKGYYNLPEETKRVICEDGWLHTGDLGWLDKKGFLHINGRVKEIIIRGGENISPKEIEDIIKLYPGILDVKVIGIPAEVLQEQIAACIIPVDNQWSEEGLRDFLKKNLAYFKIPEYFVTFDRFPVNASGKVKLYELKALTIEKIREKCK